MRQKSQILVNAFICYKQKFTVASFNLAHPVGPMLEYASTVYVVSVQRRQTSGIGSELVY